MAQAIAAAPQIEQGATHVQGTVQDVQGDPVPDAKVTLAGAGILGAHEATSKQDGSFEFTGVPAGSYRVEVAAAGLEPFTSEEFAVRPGAAVTVPSIALRIAVSTSVQVVATPEQIAVAQIHEEEKQRVFGVFPNFYTSYIWNAQPMPTNQKYKLALRSLIDPVHFLTAAGLAGAEQYNGTFPGYGPGIEGYGKRYGAALADSVTARMVGYAILPSVLHQDPRYFYQGSGGKKKRLLHAVASSFITR